MGLNRSYEFLQLVTFMSFLEVVKSRHSVRSYKSDPISDDLIKSIMEIASTAPSWCNSQPWKVIVATGESLKAIKSEYLTLSKSCTDPKPDILRLHRSHLSKESAQCMCCFYSLDPLKNCEFNSHQPSLFNAPAILYFTLPKVHSEYSVFDIGEFCMTVMLAAKAHGLDTVPAASTITYCDVLHRILSVPEDDSFIIGIAIGYASDAKINSFVPPRMKVDEFLTIKH